LAAPQEFRVTVEPDDDAVVVRVAGDLDMSNADALTEALTEPGSGASTVVADLAGVTFMDSSAVSALVASARTLKAEGSRLALGPCSDVVARVLEITGLAEGTDDFDVQPDPRDRSRDG
jgi:anti-sigma B factor antagonist